MMMIAWSENVKIQIPEIEDQETFTFQPPTTDCLLCCTIEKLLATKLNIKKMKHTISDTIDD